MASLLFQKTAKILPPDKVPNRPLFFLQKKKGHCFPMTPPPGKP
jgi:hypothetical protein